MGERGYRITSGVGTPAPHQRLVAESYAFRRHLIATWPTPGASDLTWSDEVRLAAFTIPICVVAGAPACGIESRT